MPGVALTKSQGANTGSFGFPRRLQLRLKKDTVGSDMDKDSQEWNETCAMLKAAKEKFSGMSADELESWDEQHENDPVVAGEYASRTE